MKIKFLSKTELILLAIALIYITMVTIVNPNFLSVAVLFDFVKSSSGMLIVSMGVFLVLLSGGIDVSFMAIALFGGYTAVKLMIDLQINNLYFAFLVAISVGITLGLGNAVLIHKLKLPTFIATLGTQNIYHALMTTFVGDRTYGSGVMPSSISAFGSGRLFEIQMGAGVQGLSVFIIPLLLVLVLTWFILYKTLIGRACIALGNSEESAIRSGFNPFMIRIFVYSYLGALAGIMGVIYIAQINTAYPNSLIGDELIIIAAAVIGGTRLLGGKGKMIGVFMGVLIIYLLNSTLILLGLSASWNRFFIGLLILFSISITAYQERIKNRKLLVFTE